MKIIGHRGAAGLALENSLESIRAAIVAGVDAIEFDVRMTADQHFVLCHDASTKRVSQEDLYIDKTTRAAIQKIRLHNGEHLPMLDVVLHSVTDIPVVIEAKGSHWAEPLAALLATFPSERLTVISFHHDELARFHHLIPSVRTFVIERTKAFEAIQFAKAHKLTGVDLNFWLINPFTHWLANRNKLEILVYTVNDPWLARFLHWFYPKLSITTDVPHKLQFVRNRNLRTKQPKIEH